MTLAAAESVIAGAGFLVLAPLEPFADLASLATVTRIAERLRAPDGCPWDREQTHASLRPHLLEEAYEALAALDSGDPARLRDELGDLLFDLVGAARLAGFDAETALRAANERFAAHVARIEARAADAGRALESYSPDEMRRLWEETA